VKAPDTTQVFQPYPLFTGCLLPGQVV